MWILEEVLVHDAQSGVRRMIPVGHSSVSSVAAASAGSSVGLIVTGPRASSVAAGSHVRTARSITTPRSNSSCSTRSVTAAHRIRASTCISVGFGQTPAFLSSCAATILIGSALHSAVAWLLWLLVIFLLCHSSVVENGESIYAWPVRGGLDAFSDQGLLALTATT